MNALLVLCSLLQGIPETPENLQYKPLRFDVPDAKALRSELSNGSVVYALEDRALPKVDLKILVRAGSFWEDAAKPGVAGLCASLMRTGGTESRTPDELDDQLDFLAATLGVSMGDLSGEATLSVLSKDLDQGLELLFDVLRRPGFRQDKVDLAKAQAMERLKARNDATQGIEAREVALLTYGEFPVNRHMTGATLQAITRQDLKRFHEASFHPGNFVIAAAGDFSKRELLEKLERAMKGWASTGGRAAIPKVAHEAKPGMYFFHKEGKNINQGRVTMAHLGIQIDHPDAFSLRVLNYILGGGGFSSRLVQVVRTDHGLAYSVGSEFRPGIGFPGLMKISFQSKSESCAFAAKLCLEELDKIRKEPVTEAELAAAKQFYMDAFPGLFFENSAKTVSTFAAAELNRYPAGYFQAYREKIAAVTREDIKRVANSLLDPAKLVIVAVGNVPVIKAGDANAKLSDLGRPMTDVALPDPVTLERPKQP